MTDFFKIIPGLFLLFILDIGYSQSLSLHNMQEGIFISVDKTLAKNIEGFTIERELVRTGKTSKITSLKLPATLEGMKSSIEEAKITFSFSKHELNYEKIWEEISSENTNPNNYFINLPHVKLCTGSGWIDKDVKEGEKYKYFLKNKEGLTIVESPIFTFSREIEFPEVKLYSVSKENRTPTLSWYMSVNEKVRDFDVFRSPFGENDFKAVSTSRTTSIRKDTLWMNFRDTTISSEGLYLYYIQVKDFYGNKGKPALAVQVSNLTKETLPVFTFLEAIGHKTEKSMIVSWKIDRLERARSLHLYRSSEYDGEYAMIADLPPDDTVYIDPVPIANENYYYYIKVNDIYGESRKSARFFGLFKGHIIPLPPKMESAEKTEGGVKLVWQKVGESVRGFYVMRGEGYAGEMNQVSSFIPLKNSPMVYIDSSSTLRGQQVYSYAVLAESDTYDKSPASDTLYVRPGIKTAISAPFEFTASYKNRNIQLNWNDHSKYENYLAGYKIYRKKSNESNFELLNDSLLSNALNLYIDSTITEEAKYQYAISAVDQFGAESDLNLSSTIDMAGKLYKKPEDLWAARTDEGISLFWVMPVVKNLKGFKLYKSNGQSDFKLWKTLSPDIYEIPETEIKKGQSMFYRISAIYEGGIESEMTKAIFIRF